MLSAELPAVDPVGHRSGLRVGRHDVITLVAIERIKGVLVLGELVVGAGHLVRLVVGKR